MPLSSPASVSSSTNSGASRLVSESFQFTSRPVGVPNSAGSNEVGRSDRVWMGTKGSADARWAGPE